MRSHAERGNDKKGGAFDRLFGFSNKLKAQCLIWSFSENIDLLILKGFYFILKIQFFISFFES
ncbi:hypothetical protein JCM14076_03890 [Methylosoma difficile]